MNKIFLLLVIVMGIQAVDEMKQYGPLIQYSYDEGAIQTKRSFSPDEGIFISKFDRNGNLVKNFGKSGIARLSQLSYLATNPLFIRGLQVLNDQSILLFFQTERDGDALLGKIKIPQDGPVATSFNKAGEEAGIVLLPQHLLTDVPASSLYGIYEYPNGKTLMIFMDQQRGDYIITRVQKNLSKDMTFNHGMLMRIPKKSDWNSVLQLEDEKITFALSARGNTKDIHTLDSAFKPGKQKKSVRDKITVLKHQEQCAICLDELAQTSQQLVLLSCGHIFHRSCYQRLLESDSKKRCPLCNGPLTVIETLSAVEALKRELIAQEEPIVAAPKKSRLSEKSIMASIKQTPANILLLASGNQLRDISDSAERRSSSTSESSDVD